MKRLKIIADDKIPFLKGVFEPYADIVYLPGAKITATDVNDANAIFTRTRTKCNEALLKDSNVKFIATATIGFDHIDTEYCDAAGIRWVNAPGCNSWSVQQYISAAIVTLAKEKSLRLPDLTLGVIGVGNVGDKVARVAELLGMRVLRNDPPREEQERKTIFTAPDGNPMPERITPANEGVEETFTALDTLLAESDIVTCHTPLTKEGIYKTFHLASDDFFEKMKTGTVFINTSRGQVTDTDALKRAIHAKISEYILDVWEGEPNLDRNLLNGAFIGTPHIAGYSSDGKANGTATCVHELCKFFHLVDIPPDWYPENIPAPPAPLEISINGGNKSNEQIFYEAITHTYPIWKDSNRLKNSPETFEEQRGGYWIRREFKNFTIRPVNISDDIANTLLEIGFRIV